MCMKCVINENLSSIMKPVFGMNFVIEQIHFDIHLSRTRTQHVPVTVVPTVQADKGLWGGEGVLIGYEDRVVVDDYQYEKNIRLSDVPTAHIYFSRAFVSVPKLMKLLFYSEILDQHYAVCVTRRTVDKIEEATTFDHYILKV